MTVRLRPHHLLCMLTHVGLGYSPDFVATFRDAMGRLGSGEDALIVDGPDDLCAPLLDDPDAHCRGAGVAERDGRARAAIFDHLGLDAEPGARFGLGAPTLSRLRTAFATGAIRSACAGCDWAALCSRVAGDGYRGAVLR